MPKFALPLPEKLSNDTQTLFAVLNDEPDFSVVVVAIAYLDACLCALLGKTLLVSSVSEKILDSRSGALGSFSARADACYILGLISKAMYKDLLVLAEMRNVFAHHYHQQDFKSPETVSNCARLTYLDTLVRWDNDSGDPMFDHPSFKEPRQRFTMTVVMIQSRLIIKALEAQPFKQSDA